MRLLKKKSYWLTTLIILALLIMQPISIEQTSGSYVYKFGVLFPFLSLRLNNIVTGYQNIINVSTQAESFEIIIGSLMGSYLFCFLLAYILIKIFKKLFGFIRHRLV